ncbi:MULTISPECIES: VanZ family protein [Halobacterium]|uniref:VanZ family protein n=1 Tax=Halobacterium TaxID=2239 RepID=UPI0019643A86|nr:MULTISPECIES: VanZ family protein [Halobacterium]MDL0128071.1 VanZ family protein [Halobacterium salinarum]MDL0130818.1 VanZ family protein [Halobacterium salinarum]MDL0134991.1 VanZ family protein [Halobacterium salinarum]MDL0145377.1 VanZ family protein [Halobacterium salinarum]QRY24874.1 VanZ family protein [Halobacterium sp. BOL4-2]
MRRFPFPLVPKWLRYLGAATVAGVLLYYSVLSPPPVAPPRPDPLWDKKLHLLGYLCLGLALAYATAHRRDTILTRIAVVLVLAVGYGLLIEGLQATQPGRHPSLNDALANTIGALLASAWFVVERGVRYVRPLESTDPVDTGQ